MGVPPTRPPSTPPSKGGREEGPEGTRKEFRLPDKKVKEKEGKSTKKKEDLFDLAGGETKAKEIKKEMAEQAAVEAGEMQKMEAAAATSQVSQIGQLIQKMVDTMQIGSVGGKDFASLNLSTEPDVPEAFAGSNLTLSYVENGLTIRFDNFMTPQQEQNALNLVEQNKEQLVTMLQALQVKNIQVTEFNIGDRSVTLPRVEALPPPFQPSIAPPGTELGERERREPEERERGEER